MTELLELEETLLRLRPGCDRACMESLLAPDFVEFGASGRVWTRAAMLDELAQTQERAYTISDATCQQLAPDAALLTYRLDVNERESLRSSLWVRRDGRWQMLFHQGTSIPKVSA